MLTSFVNLNSENCLLYAIKCYDSPHCVMDEFEDDYKRIRFIKRLIIRYKRTGNIKERLLLNHIIIVYNAFGIECATRLLFYRIDSSHYNILKTFLKFLNYLPNTVIGIKGKNINTVNIDIDTKVEQILGNI